ncbi:ABC transporter permease [Oerskovia flava]|uniref:ABC transporter permease n=1 Tax=Oerskovia flava TaxID=2986422 RepID=UPI00223F5B62|nr:ABC transporter permease [Oerskovia sp. JB1-3-2]
MNDPVSSWGAVRLAAGREISTRIRSKSFVWLTIILVAVVVLAGVALNAIGSSGPTAERVGLTPQTAGLAQTLTAAGESVGTELTTTAVADEATGEAQVRDGDLDALLVGSADDFTVVVDSELSPSLAAAVTAVLQQVALTDAVEALGGDPAAVAGEIATAGPDVRVVGEAGAFDPARYVTGLVTGILLFMAIMLSGQLIAQGVVEEKTSRVVELLLATIRPWQLMAGKVLGIGAVGLLQVFLVVAAGAGTAVGLGLVDPGTIDLGAAAFWALVWFLVGFTTYALIFGALGALVSRQEDIGAVTTPVIMLMVVPYILGVSVAPWAPDNPLVVWVSYIPLCAPLLMPVRMALGGVETWEVVLSLGLSVVLLPVLVWLAGKIYSNAVLRSGSRVRLKDALRAS